MPGSHAASLPWEGWGVENRGASNRFSTIPLPVFPLKGEEWGGNVKMLA